MEPCDVLANDMGISGPPMFNPARVIRKASRREVIRQGIKPHVEDVIRVARHGNAPRLAVNHARTSHRPRYRKIPKSTVQEAPDLTRPYVGDDEVGMRVEMREQTIRVPRQGEEVVLLLQILGGDGLVVRAATGRRQVGYLVKRVAVMAVIPGVETLVHIAGLKCPAEQFLRRPCVILVNRRTDEPVRRHRDTRPGTTERGVHVIDPLAHAHSIGVGGLRDVLAVLIQTHAEEGLIPAQPVVPGNHISGNLLVGMADVWRRIRVVDRGGDVVLHCNSRRAVTRLGGVISPLVAS